MVGGLTKIELKIFVCIFMYLPIFKQNKLKKFNTFFFSCQYKQSSTLTKGNFEWKIIKKKEKKS